MNKLEKVLSWFRTKEGAEISANDYNSFHSLFREDGRVSISLTLGYDKYNKPIKSKQLILNYEAAMKVIAILHSKITIKKDDLDFLFEDEMKRAGGLL